MAIEKTTFKSVNTNENLTEVQNWLTANATEYFDSFEIVEANCSIKMSMATGAYVIITPGFSPLLQIRLADSKGNGSVSLGNKYSGAVGYIECAFKSQHGIVLTTNANDFRIFITKSNAGSTSVYAMSKVYINSTAAESWQMAAADLENSMSFTKTPYMHNNSSDTRIINAGYYWWSNNSASDVTVLLPFVFKGGTYAPNMFITPFSQYPKMVCILDINGEKYFYDGYVALKE